MIQHPGYQYLDRRSKMPRRSHMPILPCHNGNHGADLLQSPRNVHECVHGSFPPRLPRSPRLQVYDVANRLRSWTLIDAKRSGTTHHGGLHIHVPATADRSKAWNRSCSDQEYLLRVTMEPRGDSETARIRVKYTRITINF